MPVTVTRNAARARWRRRLAAPAGLIALLAASLAGAGPAQAATSCTLWLYYTTFGSSAWTHYAIGNGTSCNRRPAIASDNYGTQIEALTNDPFSGVNSGMDAWEQEPGWGEYWNWLGHFGGDGLGPHLRAPPMGPGCGGSAFGAGRVERG